MDHPTLAQAIIGLASASIGTGFGFVLSGILRGAELQDLRDTLAQRELTIEAYDARVAKQNKTIGTQIKTLDWAEGEIARLAPLAELGRKVTAQRKAALVAANAANAARKAANVTPISKRA